MAIRKAIRGLSPQELTNFREAVSRMKALSDERGYNFFAGIHGLPLPMHCQHGTRLFLPWHRAYLYFFELSLQDQVPEAVLTWWDWTSAASHASGIPAAFSTARVGGRPNPLYRAQVPPVARINGQPRQTSRAPASPSQLPR